MSISSDNDKARIISATFFAASTALESTPSISLKKDTAPVPNNNSCVPSSENDKPPFKNWAIPAKKSAAVSNKIAAVIYPAPIITLSSTLPASDIKG